jgi:hypothetical protein
MLKGRCPLGTFESKSISIVHYDSKDDVLKIELYETSPNCKKWQINLYMTKGMCRYIGEKLLEKEKTDAR